MLETIKAFSLSCSPSLSFSLPLHSSPSLPSHSHIRHLPDSSQRRAHPGQSGLVAREALDRCGVADRRGRPRHSPRDGRDWRRQRREEFDERRGIRELDGGRGPVRGRWMWIRHSGWRRATERVREMSDGKEILDFIFPRPHFFFFFLGKRGEKKEREKRFLFSRAHSPPCAPFPRPFGTSLELQRRYIYMFGELDPFAEERQWGKTQTGTTAGEKRRRQAFFFLFKHAALAHHTPTRLFNNRRLPPRGLSREDWEARKRRPPADGLGAGDGKAEEKERARERVRKRRRQFLF